MFNLYSHTSKRSESVERLTKRLEELGVKTLHYGNGVDKLEQYAYFKQHNISSPEFTTDRAVAVGWLAQGFEVVARTLTQGYAGHGVVVATKASELPEDAKVYTKYVKKKREFRVNIFKGKLVNVREKKRMSNASGDGKIRSQANGYTTTHATNVPACVTQVALEACKVTSSSFCGVDVIYNAYYNKAYVLEVNSGPSIEGSSVNDYAKAVMEYVNAA